MDLYTRHMQNIRSYLSGFSVKDDFDTDERPQESAPQAADTVEEKQNGEKQSGEEQQNVLLIDASTCARKVELIRLVLEVTGLGLKEAKDLVDLSTFTLTFTSSADMHNVARTLDELGCRYVFDNGMQK